MTTPNRTVEPGQQCIVLGQNGMAHTIRVESVSDDRRVITGTILDIPVPDDEYNYTTGERVVCEYREQKNVTRTLHYPDGTASAYVRDTNSWHIIGRHK